MRNFLEYILNFIYPLHCDICKRKLETASERRLCNNCWGRLKIQNNSHHCPIPDIKDKIYFRQAKAIGKYEGSLKECIHLVKYNRRRALARTLAELMIEYMNDYFYIDNFDYLVPVPLYRKQFLTRGFNQTQVFVNEIGKYFNKEVINNNLRRIRYTTPQYKLNRYERMKNIKGAFLVRRPEIFYNKSILLVDDVYTTGVTVNECAKVLCKSGARLVNVLVLAHGG